MTTRSVTGPHAGTLARYQLLTAALSGAKDVSKGFFEGCMSQAAFAALTMPSHGIVKVALNTLKASAERCIEPGGWAELEAMRRRYVHANRERRKATKPAVGSRGGEDPLEVERRFRIRLEVAYTELVRKVASAAVDDPEWAEVLRRHQAGFSLARLKVITGDRSEA